MAKTDRTVGEKHQIKAGSNFTGSLPGNDPDTKDNVVVYPPSVGGGLFKCPLKQGVDPKTKNHKRVVHKIEASFGGQTSWTLKVVDADHEFLLLSGTTEDGFILTDTIHLAPAENLKLETTAASSAMQAVVIYEVYSIRN